MRTFGNVACWCAFWGSLLLKHFRSASRRTTASVNLVSDFSNLSNRLITKTSADSQSRLSRHPRHCNGCHEQARLFHLSIGSCLLHLSYQSITLIINPVGAGLLNLNMDRCRNNQTAGARMPHAYRPRCRHRRDRVRHVASSSCLLHFRYCNFFFGKWTS